MCVCGVCDTRGWLTVCVCLGEEGSEVLMVHVNGVLKLYRVGWAESVLVSDCSTKV